MSPSLSDTTVNHSLSRHTQTIVGQCCPIPQCMPSNVERFIGCQQVTSLNFDHLNRIEFGPMDLEIQFIRQKIGDSDFKLGLWL